jgi:hypothetical protein
MAYVTGTIRRLNDELRKNPEKGIAVITPGVAALGAEAVKTIFRTIAVFDDFCRDSDPYGEHDFGAFEAGGEKVFFKIDYYDLAMTAHSPDPGDPAATKRVITIMLAGEY